MEVLKEKHSQNCFDGKGMPAGGNDITSESYMGPTMGSPKSPIVTADALESGAHVDLEIKPSATLSAPTIPFNSPALVNGLIYERAPTPVPAPIVVLYLPQERQECASPPPRPVNRLAHYDDVDVVIASSMELPSDVPNPTPYPEISTTVTGLKLPGIAQRQIPGGTVAPSREHLANGPVSGVLATINVNAIGLTGRLRGRANTRRNTQKRVQHGHMQKEGKENRPPKIGT